MDPSSGIRPDQDKLLAARSGALIYAGAGLLSLVESRIPGGPHLAPLPGLVALGFAVLIFRFAARLPWGALAALGPIGAALIADALATTHGPTDGAVLYVWPVLWEAYFFGRRGAIGIVFWVGLVHGVALISMPPGVGYFDRWLDVMVSTALVATVVELLSMRSRRLLESLAREARVDNLTGLLNRRGFGERAAVELARSQRQRSWLGLVSFDLDHFKVVNDEWGHGVGDRVLAATARGLDSQGRGGDLLAGMGGEEFGVLLPGAEVAEAEALAERRGALQAAAVAARLASETLDVTLPVQDEPVMRGRIHPISQVTDEITAILVDMGFSVAEGPDIETDFYNFTALNFPVGHPAREMHDTFFFPPGPDGERRLLRTHTSPVQIRTMRSQKPPIRVVCPGRTYR